LHPKFRAQKPRTKFRTFHEIIRVEVPRAESRPPPVAQTAGISAGQQKILETPHMMVKKHA
jgi:hypothetical protein